MTPINRTMHRIMWIGLTIVGAFLLFAVAADLNADHTAGIPADHQATFTTLAGQSFAQTQQTSPGLADYVTTLEVGYALHELTFAVLFLAIVLIPLRQGRRWAWWACWALMIANLGYTLTFGQHDPQILRRSLAIDLVVPALLLISLKQNVGPKPRQDTHPPGTSTRGVTAQG